MSLKLVTPPATSPVTLAEVKQFCHIDFPDNDAKLQRLINAAVGYLDGVDGIMGRALITQGYELYYDTFPGDDLEIPIGNLLSVTDVGYVDPVTLNYVTWDTANYEVDTITRDYGWVIPTNGWPSIADTFNATRIKFTAGYGPSPADVPEQIRTAICMLVDMWNEGESPQGVFPRVVSQLLEPLRLRRPQF